MEDSLSIYLKESSSYPLLTPDEEIKYATLLKNSKDSKLFIVSEMEGFKAYSLNIELLFCSLCNNADYSFIINGLIKCYSTINSSSTVLDKLLKYKKESGKVNRALNIEELESLFNINYDNNNQILKREELLKEIKKVTNYRIAFSKMFISNLRLVNNIAFKLKPYVQYNGVLDIMDLISEGNGGLIKAIENYDVGLGYRFSTYATKCIEQNIKRVMIMYKMPVRIPEYYYKDMMAYRKKVDKLEKQTGRDLSIDEISELLSIPVETIKEYEILLQSTVYLDNSVGENGEETIGDFIGSKDNVEDKVFKEFLKDDFNDLLSVLTDREKMIVKMYYGLDEYTDHKLSLEKIKDIFGVSKQRINQIKSKALIKMHIYSRKNKRFKELRDYVRK